jgi:hypothetical protein
MDLLKTVLAIVVTVKLIKSRNTIKVEYDRRHANNISIARRHEE